MLSIPHLILIFLVALIVFGPEKLPELARTLTKVMLDFRRATGGFRETLEQEMRQLEREIMERQPTDPRPAEARRPQVLPPAYSQAEPLPEHELGAEGVVESNEQATITPSEGTDSQVEGDAATTSAEKREEDPTTPPDPPGKPANGHPTAA